MVTVKREETPVTAYVDRLIIDMDKDEKTLRYVQYLRELFGEEYQNMYNIFFRLFPEHTCPYLTVRYRHGSVKVLPDDQALINCVERSTGSLGIYFVIYIGDESHASIFWFDTTNEIINRYDPSYAQGEQRDIDDLVREKFMDLFPSYEYIGNSLSSQQCVQRVRGRKRKIRYDQFCQEYILLYSIRRLCGMSHVAAAEDMAEKGDGIIHEVRELFKALVHQKRKEAGKLVPTKYDPWVPSFCRSVDR